MAVHAQKHSQDRELALSRWNITQVQHYDDQKSTEHLSRKRLLIVTLRRVSLSHRSSHSPSHHVYDITFLRDTHVTRLSILIVKN